MAVKPGKQFGSNVVPGISGTCVEKTWLSRSCEQGKAAKLLLQHHSATKRLRA